MARTKKTVGKKATAKKATAKKATAKKAIAKKAIAKKAIAKKATIKASADPSLLQAYNSAYAARYADDLGTYTHNARLLYALETRFEIADIHSVAADALTDGGGDKKCDLVYVDRDGEYAVIIQGYESQADKKEASSNKAGDLNTAINWMLGTEISRLPDRIRSAAVDLRSALDERLIKSLHIWYVHNVSESINVERELQTVEAGLLRVLHEQNWEDVRVEVIEVGKHRMAEWYSAQNTPIRVGHEFSFDIPGGYEMRDREAGENEDSKWSTAVTAIKLEALRTIFVQHQDELFSANVRSYLGSRNSDNNINNGIKRTAQDAPEDFWVYNNGLTVLVNDYKFNRARTQITIRGMSVVNGAQTTGAIGNLEGPVDESAKVQIRFVKTPDKEVLQGIVRYNNSQNRVTSADFRSNDKVQRRLRTQVESQFADLIYLGGRRGGSEDAIGRPKHFIPSDTAAQALTAFHGFPSDAYFSKGRIWEDNDRYVRVFNENLNAQHLVFVVGLLRTIEAHRNMLRNRAGELTGAEEKALEFFVQRGSIFLLMTAVAGCMEILCNKKIPNLFKASFSKSKTLGGAQKVWRPVVEAIVPLAYLLEDATKARLQKVDVEKAIAAFLGLIGSTVAANRAIYGEFAKKVTV